LRNELELGSSGRRISGNSSRYCRLRSTRPSTAPRGRGTGGQRADSHWPRDSAEGFFGLRRGWGDREKAKMGSVSVLVGRAAHPTRRQPCAAQRARPDPPTRPRTPRPLRRRSRRFASCHAPGYRVRGTGGQRSWGRERDRGRERIGERELTLH